MCRCHILLVKCMAKCMGCTLGREIAQATLGATPTVHGLIQWFLNFLEVPNPASFMRAFTEPRKYIF